MNSFSLLIPTYGRAALLRRLLIYYKNERFPYPIVIADSSEPGVAEENRRTVQASDSLQLIYLSFEPTTEIYEKITHALATINSRYIGLCSDDDFIATRAPARAVEFLEQNPDYAAVGGLSIAGQVQNGHLSITAFPQRAREEETASLRLTQYLRETSANFYFIYHQTVFMDMLSRVSRFRTDNTRFEELAVSALGLINGKVGLLNNIHLVRQSSRYRPDSGSRQTGGWQTVVHSPSFYKNRSQFVTMLTEALAETGLEQGVARDCVSTFFDSYLKTVLRSKRRENRLTHYERALAVALLPSAPTLLRRTVQRAVGGLLSLAPSVRAMQREFEPIAQLLKKYPDGILEK